MKLYYGAAYYPELWNDDVIEQDIALMKEANINVVRMGEFAWSVLEPHENDFHVDAFVEVIKKLHDNGINTVFCTPTATPPIWISNNHPERMIVDVNGRTMTHGGRQQVCTNNPYFRKRAEIIIDKIAQVYGNMPGVIGWQLDNEIKGNVSECYCDECRQQWIDWLKKKYGTIDCLNELWGTNIWSQSYECFEQVLAPTNFTPMGHNPSLLSAYRQFSRDKAAEFLSNHAQIIRKYSKLPITHNASLNHFIDNEKTFSNLDFASFDFYCETSQYDKMLHHINTYKTLKNQRSFWVMETAPSFSGSIYGCHIPHTNGFLKAEAAAAYASGAEGFSYWLWRQHRSGVEQTHGHVIHAWGQKAVGFENVKEAGEVKNALEKQLSDTHPSQAPMAITYSDRARSFFFSEPFEAGFDYTTQMQILYRQALETGIPMDVIFENHSFDGYQLLFSPYLLHVSDEYLNKALAFVENGGVWIVGPMSSIRTAEHTVHTDFALGKLEQRLGIKTSAHYPITGTGAVGKAFKTEAPLTKWSTLFEDENAIGIVEGGLTPNKSFVSEVKYGKGFVVLLGSTPDDDGSMIKNLLNHYISVTSYEQHVTASQGTIVVKRENDMIEQYIVINMDGKGGKVSADFLEESIEIAPFEYHLLSRTKE